MRAVTRPVYASPTVTAVNLDSSRPDAATPLPCYPDACFAVDNFDAAFDDLVLHDPDHCYCVVLHAVLDDYAGGGSEGGPMTPLCDVDDRALSTRLSSGGGAFGSVGGAGMGAEHAQHGGAAGLAAAAEQQQQQQAELPPLPAAPSPIRTASGLTSSTATATANTTTAAAAAAADPARAPSSAGGAGGSHPGDATAAGGSPSAWRITTRQRCLFAGYVSYEQIVAFIAHSRGPARNLLETILGSPPEGAKDKVVMTGPGGVGRAEVAVTRLEPGSEATSNATGSAAAAANGGKGSAWPAAPQAAAGGGGGGGGLLQRGFSRARQVATGLHKVLTADGGGAAEGPWNVRCALMMLRLPVEHLAREVLEGV